jgi:hypothetical protein
MWPLVVTLAGCRNPCDLVEAELRTRETQIHELRSELYRLGACNDALLREVQALRGTSCAQIPIEEASQTLPLRSIVLGRQTGGLDEDGLPGDEALQVLVEPRDADGHTLKTPGILVVRTLEVTPEGLKKPLSSWQVNGNALCRNWRSGLLSTGYYLILPWKTWPGTEKVRVIATFVLADGRSFEAERDVTIRLAPIEYRKPAPPEPAELSPGPPVGLPPLAPEVLPSPRPLTAPGSGGSASQRPRGTDRTGTTRPAAYWPNTPRVPLSEAIQLLSPVALPQRLEWGP